MHGPPTDSSATTKPVDTGRECRWIDGGGHEWLIAREGGSLIVERPQTGESVVVRFPDLALEALDGPPTEAWMLFCAADGHLFHCSICREAEVIEFSRNNRSRLGSAPPQRSDGGHRTDRPSRA